MTRILAETALLPSGWSENVAVTIRGGRIEAVETGIAGGRGALLPAPTNLHSHTFQRAMAGLTEARGPAGDSFWTWRALMYRFLEKLTPEHIEAIAAYAQIEMAEAGYAACAEFHYVHHAPDGTPYDDLAETSARVAAAADRTGLGLTLVPTLYQWGGCDLRPLGPGQVRFGNDPDRFARLLDGAEAALAQPDARLAVAAHSIRAVDPDGLHAAEHMRPDAPFHIHLAEQGPEVVEVLAERGARPVTWLLNMFDVDPRWCLIHCTQTTPAETTGLALSGAVVGLCPVTESSLGDGIFDGAEFLAQGGTFGVGTDSNIRISLAEELRTLEYSQRLRDRERAVLGDHRSTGKRLFDEALKGGAQAAGRAAGAIALGQWADLMLLDTGATEMLGKTGDRLLDAFVFGRGDGALSDLWSAGRHIVAEGRHVAREPVEAAYRAAMTDLQGAL